MIEVEWLLDHAPDLRRDLRQRRLAERRDGDDPAEVVGARTSEELHDTLSGDAGHHQIEDDHVVVSDEQFLDGLGAVARNVDIELIARQDSLEHEADPRVVVYDQCLTPEHALVRSKSGATPPCRIVPRAMWTARRILKELADPDRRRRVLSAFWRHAEPQSRLLASAHLAQAMHFREETLRKMPADKKADLLASRIGAPELDQFLEMGLMQYHTHEQGGMMGSFLDLWNVPHVDGSIEVDDYKAPSADQVRAAVSELESRYDRPDIVLYLASLGLLMAEQWREATWPVVDEMTSGSGK